MAQIYSNQRLVTEDIDFGLFSRSLVSSSLEPVGTRYFQTWNASLDGAIDGFNDWRLTAQGLAATTPQAAKVDDLIITDLATFRITQIKDFNYSYMGF
jgi:hypothetical protein